LIRRIACVTDTFPPEAEVVLHMNEAQIPATVVKDDGETVVVRYDHPTLEGQTTAVPVMRQFVTVPGAAPPQAQAPIEPEASAAAEPSLVPEPVEAEEVVLHGQDLSAGEPG
jgi:hypothetical protein